MTSLTEIPMCRAEFSFQGCSIGFIEIVRFARTNIRSESAAGSYVPAPGHRCKKFYALSEFLLRRRFINLELEFPQVARVD